MLRTICRVWITPRGRCGMYRDGGPGVNAPLGEIAIDRPRALSLTSAHVAPPIHANQDFANTSRIHPALAAPGRPRPHGRGSAPSPLAPVRLRLGRQVHDRPADRHHGPCRPGTALEHAV